VKKISPLRKMEEKKEGKIKDKLMGNKSFYFFFQDKISSNPTVHLPALSLHFQITLYFLLNKKYYGTVLEVLYG
jgi:hypothetical protein